MSAVVHPRDLIVCVLARERKHLADAELEQVVRQWLAEPERSLVDMITERARLTLSESAELKSAAANAAIETMLDPVGQRLAQLSPEVQRLLAPDSVPAVGVSDRPTKRIGDTLPGTPGSASRGASRSMAPESLTPGTRFDILQVHAQGGLGVVFQARDHEIERMVALKQIKAQWADDADSRARFLLEARVTGRLEHPGIVPIYALGADASGRPYYAMRFIRGESLLEVINRFHRGRSGRSPAERMSELRKLLLRFLDVCHAVDYAHSKGVIHRDLKPSNIMLGKYGETLVVDWGLAKVIGSEEDVALTTRMVAEHGEHELGGTMLGAAIGTPAYMSPEQAAGRHNELTPTTDVFSLGATLYHLLTGAVPHESDADVAVAVSQAENEPIVPPRQRVPWLPKPLESICMKALAPSPADRYLSARFLAEEIDAWLADEPVEAHRDSLGERAFRWMRNHRAFVIAFVAVDLVATAAVVIGVLGWNHLQAERTKIERERNTAQAESRQRNEQRVASLAASVQSAEQSAAVELAAGRFGPALEFLRSAERTLGDDEDQDESLAEVRRRVEARRDDVERLVTFQQSGDRAEELGFTQQDAEALVALRQSLGALGVFEGGDWWSRLPIEGLSAAQVDELQQNVYRKLILLVSAHAKEVFKNLLAPRGRDEALELLRVAELVQRFRPAEATRWHASFARSRLGQGAPLAAADLAPPENAADAYMLAGIWAVSDQNQVLRAMFARDDRDALEACKRKLRAAEELEPRDYWSHFLLAYVEMLQANRPGQSLAATHDHFAAARQALSHCLAIRPDHWQPYAERAATCWQELEARREAARSGEAPTPRPIGWESDEELVRLMIHDSKFALELAGPYSEAAWYSGFSLVIAGQEEQGVDGLLTAVEAANRYDVEPTPRMVDRERDEALPGALEIADRLIAENGAEPRRRLLRAMTNVRLGNWNDAAADVEAALAAGESAPATARSVRGEIRLHDGRYAEAREDFEAALMAFPEHPPSLLGLAASLEGEGNRVAALTAFDRAKAAARTPFEEAAAELGRARLLSRLGRSGDARAAVKALRTIKPAIELTSVIAAAKEAGDEKLVADLEALARSGVGEIAAAPRPYRTLPVLNGSFELGLVAHWNNDDVDGLSWHNVRPFESSAEATTEVAHTGKRSLHIVASSSQTPGAYGVTSQRVPADPHSRYRITLWAKAENLSENAVSIVLDDRLGESILVAPSGTYDWRELSAEFDLGGSSALLREGLRDVAIRLVAQGPGEAWIDDLRIETVEPTQADESAKK